MRHPKLLPEIVLADNRVGSLRHLPEHESRIDIAQLNQRLHLELQIMCLEILQVVNVSARIHVNRQSVPILIATS